MAKEAKRSGDPTACSPGDLSKPKVRETTFENTKLNVVSLNWKEVYYTNCPSCPPAMSIRSWAGPGGVQEDRREVRLSPLRPRERLVPALHPQPRQPHPFRRPVPPIHVHADIRRTVLLG